MNVYVDILIYRAGIEILSNGNFQFDKWGGLQEFEYVHHH